MLSKEESESTMRWFVCDIAVFLCCSFENNQKGFLFFFFVSPQNFALTIAQNQNQLNNDNNNDDNRKIIWQTNRRRMQFDFFVCAQSDNTRMIALELLR